MQEVLTCQKEKRSTISARDCDNDLSVRSNRLKKPLRRRKEGLMVELRKITKENWYECTQLKITDEQKRYFPAPPVYWLAECRYMQDWYELAVYCDGRMIGFTVYGLDPDNDEYWICAIMIDQEHQGKGHGKAAIRQMIDLINSRHGRSKLYIGHRKENETAANLYESLGFIDTGERFNDEIIRRKDII